MAGRGHCVTLSAMISLSAIEAISPAVERTRQFLFRPFRWGRFLKLTVVAALTEGGMSSCNFNHGTGNSGVWNHPFHIPQMHFPGMPFLVGLILGIVLFTIALGILIAYLIIRLRFSFFDCLLRGQDKIGPAWARYHAQAMRYLGLNLCIGVGFWAVLLIAAYNIYQKFKPLIESLGSDQQHNFADFLPLIAAVGSVLLVLGILIALIEIALSNFMLPRMALEDASISEAVGEVWTDFLEEPWQYLLFVILRFVLSLVASILAVIVLVIPLVFLVLIGVVLFFILKAASTVVAVLLGVPAGIILLALFILACFAAGGTIGTFRRNYAMLFYGGRYPALGDILQPPAPPPPPSPAWQPVQPPGQPWQPGPGARGFGGGV
jgi:hypothetical protein